MKILLSGITVRYEVGGRMSAASKWTWDRKAYFELRSQLKIALYDAQLGDDCHKSARFLQQKA